ncbi:MAG: serine/threonine protein kinase [Candidatus Obscuribacterales bacterium]|nr:serine/threonine protein kinase [Candidatus Obscuribacterales bacterium]
MDNRQKDLLVTSSPISIERKPQLKAVQTDDRLSDSMADASGAKVLFTDYATVTSPELASAETIPPEIGEYEILGKLGSGGMGVVYRARKKGTNFEVALKVLPDALASDEHCKSRLQQEANSAAKLTHVNLVTVFENSRQGTSYIAMELIHGQSLAQMLESQGALSLEQFHHIFTQVCDGLLHAHSKGIVHRDIKPGNIMITPEGIVKIADFGIARMLEAFDQNPQTKLTATHVVLGTPAYMSPEQCLGLDLDVRSDIYSLGAVMFQSLAGREIFEGKNPIQVIAKHLHEDPPSVRAVDSAIPVPVSEVILRCLQKDPAQRYQDAGQVLLALKYADSKPKDRLPDKYRLPVRKQKPSRSAVPGVILIGALCFVGGLFFFNSTTSRVLTGTSEAKIEPKTEAELAAVLESEIRQWKSDLVAAKDVSERVLYTRWIGDAYMELAFPTPESYTKQLDAKRRSYLLTASRNLRQSVKLQEELNPDDAVLDNIYDHLQKASYYLDCESDRLKYSQARAKFLERSPKRLNESLVQCYYDIASSLNRLEYDKKQIKDSFRKSISYDKLLHGSLIGDCVLASYTDLVYELERGGENREALVVVNEQIQREIARWGLYDSVLRYAYESKARLLDNLKRHEEAKKVREQIRQLKPSEIDTGPGYKVSIEFLESEFEKADNDRDRATAIASIIWQYMYEAFPTNESWTEHLDGKQTKLMNAALRWFQKYANLIPSVHPHRSELVQFYSSYFNVLFALGRFNDAVNIAQKRCQLYEAPQAVLDNKAVRALSDLANVYIRTGQEPKIIDEILSRALTSNKNLHGDKVCLAAVDAYSMLADGKLAEGDLNGALKLVDEAVDKTIVTFGKRSKCLKDLLVLKLKVCEHLHRPELIKKVGVQLSGLNKDFTEEEVVKD